MIGDKNELTWACADSGYTANVFIPGTPLKNLRPTTKPIKLKTAGGEYIETTHEGEIDIPGLHKAATKAHICPGLANTSLVGIKTLVDAGCEVLFSKDDCIVLYKGSIIWKGGRQARSGLWILPLSPEDVEEMNKLQIEPTAWLATVEQLPKEAKMNDQTRDEQVNNVFHTTTKAELIKYLHQAAFSPVKATWKKAIENGQFTTWPGLTPEAVEKYLPRHSPATDKGHMSRQRQGVRPTKTEKWVTKKLREWRQESSKEAAVWLNSEEAADDMTPKQEESKINELFCATMTINPKDGTTYMDCTGKFPVRSLKGMVTLFIMYDWSSNSILAEPIANTKDETIIKEFSEKLEYLKKRGFKPRFNILDNIASKAIITYLKEEAKIGVQLVEPHNH